MYKIKKIKVQLWNRRYSYEMYELYTCDV